MSKGRVQAYYGEGRGKTSAALGYAIREAGHEGECIIIQFLKNRDEGEISFISRLEPEIRLFRFQKSDRLYSELSEEEKKDERMNMKNGINYARKVLQTGECSTLILDEVLGLIEQDVISEQDLIDLIGLRSEETEIILTGSRLPDGLFSYVDDIFEICLKKSSWH